MESCFFLGWEIAKNYKRLLNLRIVSLQFDTDWASLLLENFLLQYQPIYLVQSTVVFQMKVGISILPFYEQAISTKYCLDWQA